MTPDYDLTDLHTGLADLWFYLKADAILAEILADRPERETSPLALGAVTDGFITHVAGETAGDTPQHPAGSGLLGVGLGNKEVN
jgi:hypothetical protein